MKNFNEIKLNAIAARLKYKNIITYVRINKRNKLTVEFVDTRLLIVY
jgi:hypothetical protein